MLEETIDYTRSRKLFSQTVLDFQNTRFSLAAAKAEATMLRAFVDECLGEVMEGTLTGEKAAMAKLTGSEMQGRLLDQFLQLHGGYGFMSEYKVARAWVDAGAGLDQPALTPRSVWPACAGRWGRPRLPGPVTWSCSPRCPAPRPSYGC